MSNPNPINVLGFGIPGTIAAAALIAAMTGAVQLAKAGVNSLNFKTGGYNPHGFGGLSGLQFGAKQINIVEDGRPEFIHNANSTSKNLQHYKALNSSNESFVKYAVRLPEVRNQILAEMTNALGTNQNEFVKVIKEFNANANARKTSKVNVDAKINVDSSRMIKEVEFKSYQEARR